MIKLAIHINGMYTEEYTDMLKQELKFLDDVNNLECQKLRKDLGISKLQEKDLIKYKIDFLVNNINQNHLYCLEKNACFKKLLIKCFDKESLEIIEPIIFACITDDSKLKMFWIFIDNEDDSKLFYEISSEGEMFKTNKESIKKQLLNGMVTLSETRRMDFKDLLEDDYENNEDLQL